MRYTKEVMSQVDLDLHHEFGMEWGLTRPITDENAQYAQATETKTDRIHEIAQKIKRENWRDRD